MTTQTQRPNHTAPSPVDTREIERIAVRLLDEEIHTNQTALINALFQQSTLDGFDVDHLSVIAEVSQWWLVSQDLADELAFMDQCVLSNDFGTWWGRCTCGQAILMDGVLQAVAASRIARAS